MAFCPQPKSGDAVFPLMRIRGGISMGDALSAASHADRTAF
jgi:hypothetical protein